ncbi:Hypp1727 [Branchiostoma lanceolatum]|uniref:Mitochondria-eating protein n=3 Tax=Branchiostoma lanceolatum TaxID=7740 RepID=A0A8J9ZJX9_BRALA|nr:Hypp1727 [Branchiostoma lanceolatum]
MAGRPRTAPPMSDPFSAGALQQDDELAQQINDWASSMLSSITNNMTTGVSHWSAIMTQLSSENARLSRELKDLRERTAGIADKLAVSDRKNVEDLRDLNRSSKMSERYYQFTDGARMDAVETLNKYFPRNKLTNDRLICETFEIAFEVATVAMSNIQEHLQILKNPTSGRALQPTQRAETRKEATEDQFKYSTKTSFGDEQARKIMESVSAYLRQTSDMVDTTPMEEDVLTELQKRRIYHEQHYQIDKNISEKFIPVFCKMAWQLAVQAPSLQIEYKQMAFSPDMHDVAEPTKKNKSGRSTCMSSTPKIKHYLWPALIDPQNGTVLRKGIVRLANS